MQNLVTEVLFTIKLQLEGFNYKGTVWFKYEQPISLTLNAFFLSIFSFQGQAPMTQILNLPNTVAYIKSMHCPRFSFSEVSRSVITVLWDIWNSSYCGPLKSMLTRIDIHCCAAQFAGMNSKRWQNTEFYTNEGLIKIN